jgi:mono/diheme cytochrome c family protein
MNYPVWYLPTTGGGMLIALIAIFHVFVSHFAVGGGLYLIFAEKKGLREKSREILAFTERHARFFLLVTMVFGSITGVGIWFIIALVNPAATSLLIHNFVFGWAAEWVFFTVEIAAAFIYYYMFGRMDSATHLKVGWVYFGAAWMSLFLINGIIGVMLTPGSWAENMDFWVGFFNPSFFPSLFFRTFIAIMIAACYGYLSASFAKDARVRMAMTRFSAGWALAALAAALPAGIWYLAVLPDQAHTLVMGKSPTIGAVMPLAAAGVVILLVIMLGAGVFRPSFNLKPVAGLAMIGALLVMGGFEWTREAARRPFVINEVMYSNSIMKKDVAELNRDGFLRKALWVEARAATGENRLAAGREIFIQQCYACHTVHGRNNDIVEATAKMSYRALVGYLGKIHETRYFMPPFVGTEDERSALAAYIAGGLHGKDISEPEPVAGGIDQGKALFEENCSSCHVLDDLAAPLQGRSRKELVEMLGKLNEISEEMTPFAGSAEEGEELAGYLYALNSQAGAPAEVKGETPASDEGGDQGRQAFQNHCNSCHGLEDLQMKTAERDRPEIFSLLGRLEQVQKAMPPFRGSAAEREALADFLESLKKGEQEWNR